MDRLWIFVRGGSAANKRRHRCRAFETEAPRCTRASETGGRSSFGFRNPDERKILSSVVDAAGALAFANLCRCRGPARYCVDALDDLRHHIRPCAERCKAGVGGSDNGSARYWPAHTGRDAECQGGRFRFDRMSELRSLSLGFQTALAQLFYDLCLEDHVPELCGKLGDGHDQVARSP